jgi:thiamine-phosphate pyrophosphorylase
MRGLYAIVDTGTLSARGLDPLLFARALVAARPAALQLRAKDLPPREILALLRALHPLCRTAGVPLVVNDRPDLAALGGCDMVHVGQEDVPIELVRRLAPGLSVGVSTHTVDQLARALESRPTYVAYGPVFPTTTKAKADPVVGLSGLRAAAALAAKAKVPLVAIGGISLERARDVAGVADAGAVISGLLPAEAGAMDANAAMYAEVTARANAFHAALGHGEARTVEALA